MGRAVLTLLALLTTLVLITFVHGLGVNWGTMASHPLNPDIVVRLLKDNGFTKVKLFEADSWTVGALAGSGIEVMVGIPNNRLADFANSYGDCKDWVKENVTKHLYNGGVNIKFVAVGNEPFLSSYNGSFIQTTLPAMQNIQKALSEAGHGGQIKVTTPLNADVYESSSDKPSDGDFRKDMRNLMHQIVNFLKQNDSPFLVNIYPFLSLYQNANFPFNFSFFDGATRIQDKNVQYTNVFDANYDTLVWALKKAGAPDLKIVVGEVGWPTEANKNANVKLAQKFYDGLFKKLNSNQGTPLRPGKLEVYLFSLFDEDQKSIAPGFFERHWGIFRYDGQPKFPMSLPGKGKSNSSSSGNLQDRMPIGAKGVEYLTAQWCVFAGETADMNAVPSNMDYACSMADCTALIYGSSCNHLDSKGNVSYVYNMHFQTQDQDVRACDFQGTAKIVTKNASTGTCLFPIQIVSAAHRLRLPAPAFLISAGFLLSLFI